MASTPVLQPVVDECRVANETTPQTAISSDEKNGVESRPSASNRVEVVMLYDTTALSRLFSQISPGTGLDSHVDNQEGTKPGFNV